MDAVKGLVAAAALWLLAGVVAPAAAAETFEAGMAAYEAEDYAKAYEVWKPLAEAGDPRAQYELGNLYRFAEGVEQDYAKALDWLTKAARQKTDPDMMRRAVYGLGYMVEYGHGIERDLEKAECLYRVSAENNYPSGQFGLSVFLRDKPGIDREAYDWSERAAMQGYVPALALVGKVLITNPFTDPTEGYTLIAVAASKGDAEAIALIEEASTYDDPAWGIAAEAGERLAAEWQPIVQPIPGPPVGVPEECWP